MSSHTRNLALAAPLPPQFEGWMIFCPHTKKFLADDEHGWTPDEGQAAILTSYDLAKDIGVREAPKNCTFMLLGVVAGAGIIAPSEHNAAATQPAIAETDEQVIDRLTEDGLNAIAKLVQDELGVTAGDVAGVYYSDEWHRAALRAMISGHFDLEIQYGAHGAGAPEKGLG